MGLFIIWIWKCISPDRYTLQCDITHCIDIYDLIVGSSNFIEKPYEIIAAAYMCFPCCYNITVSVAHIEVNNNVDTILHDTLTVVAKKVIFGAESHNFTFSLTYPVDPFLPILRSQAGMYLQLLYHVYKVGRKSKHVTPKKRTQAE